MTPPFEVSGTVELDVLATLAELGWQFEGQPAVVLSDGEAGVSFSFVVAEAEPGERELTVAAVDDDDRIGRASIQLTVLPAEPGTTPGETTTTAETTTGGTSTGDTTTNGTSTGDTTTNGTTSESTTTETSEPDGIVYTWRGGSASWNVAQEWDPEGIPGPFDRAIVEGGTVELDTGADVVVRDLEVRGSSTRLEGEDDLRVRRTLLHEGGFFGGEGTLVIGEAAVATWTRGSNLEAYEREVLVLGEYHFEGAGGLILSEGALFRNEGVVRMHAAGQITGPQAAPDGDLPTVENEGRLIVDVAEEGVAVFQNHLVFVNQGEVEVRGGTLALRNRGGVAEHGGSILAEEGATLVLGGGNGSPFDHRFGAGASLVAPGEVVISSAAEVTFASGSTLDVAGTLRMADGSAPLGVLVIEDATVDLSGSVEVVRGMLRAESTTPLLLPDAWIGTADAPTSGTLEGSGDVVVPDGGTLRLGPGNLAGTGTLRVDDGGALEYVNESLNPAVIDRALVVDGVFQWSGARRIEIDEGGSILNRGDVLLDGSGAANITSRGVSGFREITNEGRWVVGGDGAERSLQNRVQFVNEGRMEIDQDLLWDVSGPVSEHSGEFAIAEGATLRLGMSGSPPEHRFVDGALLSGGGDVHVDGNLRFVFEAGSAVDMEGVLRSTSGSNGHLVDFRDADSLAFGGLLLEHNWGTVRLDHDALIVRGDLEVIHEVAFQGELHFSNATFEGSEAAVIDTDEPLDFVNLTIANTGGVTHRGARIDVSSLLTVEAGASFTSEGNVQADSCAFDGTVDGPDIDCVQ